ncbi:MAG: hypothetical protein ACREJ0_10260, partial [Geminicoccaceae bacterium]
MEIDVDPPWNRCSPRTEVDPKTLRPGVDTEGYKLTLHERATAVFQLARKRTSQLAHFPQLLS